MMRLIHDAKVTLFLSLPLPVETDPQPVPAQSLSDAGVLGLLALLSAFIPLSTDMYLPALPTMTKAFHAPTALVNLTLILFFVFYSLGTLLWGPLSDKYGRKAVLLIGLALYILASIGCACAAGVYEMIVFRVLQAIAGACSPAIAIALVKDLFHGRKRERGLVLIQSMVMIAPIVAPVLGALLLKFTSWRGVFWTLSGFGVVALCWSLALRETVTHHYRGTILQTLGQLGRVLQNPGFSVLLVIFSVVIMPLYAYLAASSYIYIKEFHLSALAFSYFFVCNAVSAVLAPLLYLRISHHIAGLRVLPWCFMVIAASGIAICTLGQLSPLLLALSIIPATMAMGMVRPPSTHLMLEQQHTAIGTASSLITCAMALLGSVGMLIMSCGWRSMIVPLGMVHLCAGIVSGVSWWTVRHRPYIKYEDRV